MTDYTNATHIAICPNYFGKGFSVEECKANMKAQGGSLESYYVLELPAGAEGAFVTDVGNLQWRWADGADTSAEPKMVESRGLA